MKFIKTWWSSLDWGTRTYLKEHVFPVMVSVVPILVLFPLWVLSL